MMIRLDIADLDEWLSRNQGKTKEEYVEQVREWSGQLWEVLGIGEEPVIEIEANGREWKIETAGDRRSPVQEDEL